MSDVTCDLPHLPENEAAARRNLLVGDRTVVVIAETFRVLGDPTRVRILDALSEGEFCVCDIAALVGISESAVSHQLRLLRGMRLVRPRRAGRHVFYSVDDQHIVELLRLAVTHVEEISRAGELVGSRGLGELVSRGAGERGSGGAEERGSGRAGKLGSRRAGEPVSSPAPQLPRSPA